MNVTTMDRAKMSGRMSLRHLGRGDRCPTQFQSLISWRLLSKTRPCKVGFDPCVSSMRDLSNLASERVEQPASCDPRAWGNQLVSEHALPTTPENESLVDHTA